MKKILFAIFIIATSVQAEQMKLVWADEFNYEGLPDSTRWNYEKGFIRNNELQYYTDHRQRNARVSDGTLIIEARREKFSNSAYDPADLKDWKKTREFAEYTSACLNTQNRASWTYGRIEARAKLPSGTGIWPAIWMLGTNKKNTGWPACGEIDIMEFVGYMPNLVHGTVHTGKFNHVKKTQKGSELEIINLCDDFHVFAVEWDSLKIDFFVDEKKYFTFENDGTGLDAWPFDSDQYLILNIAVGGAWGGLKGVDDSIFPQRMYVDYVRVYQKEK